MRKFLIVGFVSGLIGFVAGNAFWYLASPLWIDVEVIETASAAQTAEIVAQGKFVDADRLHKGKGSATIYEGTTGERILRLANFEVTNGPDLKVWLVSHPDPTSAGDVTDSRWISLGRLKGNIGDQNYDIPAEVDLNKFGSVIIWCEQFSVLFSTAALE